MYGNSDKENKDQYGIQQPTDKIKFNDGNRVITSPDLIKKGYKKNIIDFGEHFILNTKTTKINAVN